MPAENGLLGRPNLWECNLMVIGQLLAIDDPYNKVQVSKLEKLLLAQNAFNVSLVISWKQLGS